MIGTRTGAATVAFVLRLLFLAASASILVIRQLPALRARFLAYGSRATSNTDRKQPPASTATNRVLDYAASVQVPHNYFTHFYLLSTACSLFWGCYLPVWNAHAQLQIAWALMLLQGVRRLLESYTFTSTSTSRMWVGHWVLGLVFYLAVNVSIFIELLPVEATEAGSRLGWGTAMLAPAVLTVHVLQHTYHAYLYRLRTQNRGYQLPSHPLFPNLVCPHYTCEIAIYVLLSVLAAPEGALVNWTLASAAVFVITNLGVTAGLTKEWYMDKFGSEKIERRWNMIPWVW